MFRRRRVRRTGETTRARSRRAYQLGDASRRPRSATGDWFVTFPFDGEYYTIVWPATDGSGRALTRVDVESAFETWLRGAEFRTITTELAGEPVHVRVRASWVSTYDVWR